VASKKFGAMKWKIPEYVPAVSEVGSAESVTFVVLPVGLESGLPPSQV
jgi:hypothetical protein